LSIKNDELNVTNKDLIQKEGKNKRREKINTIKVRNESEIRERRKEIKEREEVEEKGKS
jgi:hypothetical protein